MLLFAGVSSAQSWIRQLRSLAMSLAGMTVGIILKVTIDALRSSIAGLIAWIVAMGLLGFLWLLEERGGRRCKTRDDVNVVSVAAAES